MNFKQLVVGWYAVFLIAAMAIAYAVAVEDNLQQFILLGATVVLVGGGLVYTVGDRHQVNIKRLATAVVGPPSVLAALGFLGWGLVSGLDSVSASIRAVPPDGLALSDLIVEESSVCLDLEANSVISDCLVVEGVVENATDFKLEKVRLRVTIRDTAGNMISTDVTAVDDTVYPFSGRRFSEATDLWHSLGSDIVVYTEIEGATRAHLW